MIQTMQKKIKIISLICLIVFMTMGCTMLQRFQAPQSAQGKYLTSLRFFNDTVDRYVVYYRQAKPEVQEQWKQEISPLFIEANAALDLWGLAVAAGGVTAEKERLYFQVRDSILALLLRYEIIKVTGK